MKGQQILNYKITAEIGKGGMATVYKAKHTKLATVVAVKILNPVLAANYNIRQRFMQEAKIMASLNHPGITKVLDFDETDNRLAIVMEYLQGQTLNDYIKQNGALPPDKAKQIFIKVLDAFAYAHNKGVIHRDVKPSNIFITDDGEVKIMDFGIAKIVKDEAKVLTQTGTQMGTPVYMSPEQVKDAKHIDLTTDIYSLGVTLWFMLSGQPPYDTTTISTFEILTKIVNEPLQNISENLELSNVINKATNKEKEKRFKNCQEFKNALETIKKDKEETLIEKKIPGKNSNDKKNKKIENKEYGKLREKEIKSNLSIFFQKISVLGKNVVQTIINPFFIFIIILQLFTSLGLFILKDKNKVKWIFLLFKVFLIVFIIIIGKHYFDLLWFDYHVPLSTPIFLFISFLLLGLEMIYTILIFKKGKHINPKKYFFSSIVLFVILVMYSYYQTVYVGNYEGHDKYPHEGLLAVKDKGKYGFINIWGKVVIPIKFEYKKDYYSDEWPRFYNGKAEIYLNNKKITINTKGECIKDCP